MSGDIKDIGREEDGTLPAYAWPGGYPIVYVFADGETCCPKCANGSDVWIAPKPGKDPVTDKQWQLVSWFVHYEGKPETCADCGEEVESAYGDPDEEEVDPIAVAVAERLKKWPDCPACAERRIHIPSHDGSRFCKSGAVAAGGNKIHCSCDRCW